MKLKSIREYKGKIILKSGLHIGAGDTELRIGGTDNPVIKHPHTLEPYIPGSSVKGKIRSLLELKSGIIGKRSSGSGSPLGLKDLSLDNTDKDCEKILKLFGMSGADSDETGKIGPSRLSFADCSLDPEWKSKAFSRNLPLTEVKSENSIDRIKGTSLNPRFTERVPAETEFTFTITLKEFDMDEGQNLETFLFEGMKLLEMDALGGSGSRGYGRIRFEFDDTDTQKKFETVKPL
jgi:CRISPR-associated protein Csm3